MGTTVLKSQVQLVVLDVVVTDKKGHPVRGLKAADFTVLEAGQEMTVQDFEEHRLDQAPPPSPTPSKHDLGLNVFTNITDTPNNGPLNVLLLDALNTSMADQANVRAQMLGYLKTMPEGTPIAIFGLSSHLYILQGFTTDPALLKAALSGKKGLPKSSQSLSTTADDAAQEDQLAMVRSSMARSHSAAQVLANIRQFQSEQNSFQDAQRVQYTLAAMNALGRYLAGLPGRKNLIWFSGSFPLDVIPDGGLRGSIRPSSAFGDDVRSTADLMTRAQVAVYPVDGRGLVTSPAYDPEASGVNGDSGPHNPSELIPENTGDHANMERIAEQTGGKALYDSNDLKEAVQEAVDHGSNYYTLTYSPIRRQWDGSYRSVRVNLDQSGMNLFYRHGYYADDPMAPSVHGRNSLPTNLSPMETAMQRGGPNLTQLTLNVKIVPGTALEKTLPSFNRPNEKLMKPPYRHYTVYYSLDPRNIAFTPSPDGAHHASIEILTRLYSSNGEVVNSIGSRVRASPSAAKYNEWMQRGLTLSQDIDAPAKGEYFLRMGVHDINTDHVGAVEVPLASIQPEPASPATGLKAR